jgi:hypothetical protein
MLEMRTDTLEAAAFRKQFALSRVKPARFLRRHGRLSPKAMVPHFLRASPLLACAEAGVQSIILSLDCSR